MTETKLKRSWFSFSLRTLFRAVAFTFLSDPLAIGQDQSPPLVTIEAIVAKWKERDQYFQSFVFECNGEHFQAELNDPARNFTAPEDLFHCRRRFVLSNDGRNRTEEDGREWDESTKMFIPRQVVEVFDGKDQNSLYDGGRNDHPIVFLGNHNGDKFGKSLGNVPIRMALCPFRAGVGEFNATNLTLTNETATVNNDPVLVVKSGDKKIWVDPKMDFLPVKREDEGRAWPMKIEISYVHDKTYGWIPSRWTTNRLGQNGKSTWQDTMTVTKFSINKPIDNAEFELLLPPGTVVFEPKTGGRRTVQGGFERLHSVLGPAETKP